MAVLRCVVCAALLPVVLAGQSPTLTATAGTPFSLAVEHLGLAPRSAATIAEGTDIQNGLQLAVVSGQARGSLSFQAKTGHIATFESHVACAAMTFGTTGGAVLASDADFRLSIANTAAVRGMLAIWIHTVPSGGYPAYGVYQVDVDDNGTWDLAGSPFGPFEVYGEFTRVVGATPLPIRVLLTGGFSLPPNDIGDYRADVYVRWIPDTAAVTSYGNPCGLDLVEQRLPGGEFTFSLLQGATVDTWLLFGNAQRNIPLNLPPYCALLTDIDFLAHWPNGAFVVPYVPLPAGFLLHVQAVQFNSVQSTLLSNGLRLQMGT
jgi:hypothetical protein